MASEPIKIPEPIQIVIEQKVEEPVETPKLYTLEEKIKLNVNECDESTQYIRADDATCLAKPVYVPPAPQSTVRTAVNSPKVTSSSASTAPSGWFPYGQCTYYVSTQRSVGQWNNAISWTWQAQRDGWSTGTTPVTGAIGQKGNHVVYVTGVNSDGTFNLSEMNYSGLGVITHRTVSSVGWSFIY